MDGQELEDRLRPVRPADPRPRPFPARHEVGRRPHPLQGPQGRHLPAGRPGEGAYGDGKVPVWNAPGCTTADVVYSDLRTTNGWDNAYKLDFDNPCAQKYIDSQAQQFADWGYDFLKLDGVGPGSFKSGDNYNNVADVAAWQKAIATAGRPIHLELSWSLDIGHAADWKQYSNGWRIDTDVECYCNTLVTWENSVNDRWDDSRRGAARRPRAVGTTWTPSTSATARWTASPRPSGRAT